MFLLRKSIENRQVYDSCASGLQMKPNGLVSKFTCMNTVTSSKALLKSHEVFLKVF